ncbi:MAG: serine protease [Vezdaea aestivalis]|nr:MAG: serine protease [Vezdaea aestivalis]
MRSLLSLAILPLLASATPLRTSTIDEGAAPIISASNAKDIPDSYIVVFKKHVSEHSAQAHHSWVQDLHIATQFQQTELRKRSGEFFGDSLFDGLKHTYNIAGGLLGYSGHFDQEVIEEVRRHPDVAYVERDSEVHTLITKDEPELESNAPWGLARISHRNTLRLGTVSKYLFAGEGGEGVDAYIIDTGTNVKHVDFEGRANWGKTIPAGEADEDGNGHGTHCSGTVAGKKYGVAKKANVYAVKVLGSNGSGTMSDVVKGVEWAATSHKDQVEATKKGKGKKGFKGSVANMSLGGGKSPALDLAVDAAVELGLHFAVAAGNDNADSCGYSPAGSKKSVTVGASTLLDERAYFSNYGPCNDIFAPGLNVLSTWIGSEHATNTISGTSMASPHICGLLAYYLSLQPAKDSAYFVDEITPKKLKENIIAVGTVGALSDVPKDTENVLAWNGGGISNYTDIVKSGGYTVQRETEKAKTLKKVSMKKLRKEIEDSLEGAKEEALEYADELEDSVEIYIDRALNRITVSVHQ